MPGTNRPAAARRPLLLAALLAAAAPSPAAARPDPPDYRALWAAGRDYAGFYDAATARRALWERNTARAGVPEPLLDRARAVPGRWRLLVVAFDRCSDSVETVPYLAALADAVDGLELRIVDPETGRAVMEAHPTPDGRPATPTVILLDDGWREAGAWVERPSALQSWFIENPEGLSHDERHSRKMAWYAEDAGASTVREVVELLETAGEAR